MGQKPEGVNMHCVLREKSGLQGQKRSKTEAGDATSVKKESD